MMETEWNVIEIAGALAAGYGIIYLVQSVIKRFVNKVEGGEFLTAKEFSTYKTELSEARARLELVVSQKEFIQYQADRSARLKEVRGEIMDAVKEIKTACTAKQASCQRCIEEIKNNQSVLRQTWPVTYVHKEDFKEWKESFENWLRTIDGKVDKILTREGCIETK